MQEEIEGKENTGRSRDAGSWRKLKENAGRRKDGEENAGRSWDAGSWRILKENAGRKRGKE
jgi:hypothetical protein